MRSIPAIATAAVLVVAPSFAQSVSVQLEALTPLTVTEVAGGVTATNTVPAGVLGSYGTVASGTNANTRADLVWWIDDYETNKRISLLHTLTAAAGDFAAAGPHEFLVTITPTTPGGLVLGDLNISRLNAGTPGAPEAGVALDLNNDGTFETTNLLGFYMPLPTNGTPLVLRLVFDGTATGGTVSSNGIYFDIRPTNGLTILDAAVPCAPAYPLLELYAQPVFTNYGISFATSPINDPVVMLLGLHAQPVLLPTPAPVPCFVIPSPDLALFSLTGSPIWSQIDIPLSVRPASLYAQAIQLAPIGLVASRAVRVIAH